MTQPEMDDPTPPQLSVDNDALYNLNKLLEETPPWTEENAEAFGSELLFLFKNHVTVRAAFLVCTQVARNAELQLRGSKNWEETCRLQGEIAGLTKFYGIFMDALMNAETQGKQDNVKN